MPGGFFRPISYVSTIARLKKKGEHIARLPENPTDSSSSSCVMQLRDLAVFPHSFQSEIEPALGFLE